MAKLEAMLEQRGIASPREMSEAVARCELHGGDLTTSLLQFVSADEALLSAALSECHGLPAAIVGALPTPDEATSRLVPREVAERYCCFPLESGSGRLVLAVAGPFEPALKDELSFALGVQIDERVALEVRIRQAISRHYGLPLSARNQRGIARLDGELDGSPNETPAGLWPDTQLSALPRPPSERPISRSESPRPPGERARNEASQRDSEHPSSRTDSGPRGAGSVPPSSGLRSSRRRGPFSLALAREELSRAASRNDVLDAFFSFACQFFEYSALFAVHNALAEGLNAWGPGADREAALGIGVPLDLPSSLSEAAESCKMRLTRLGKEGIDRTLSADLRRQLNSRVLILPVCLRGRCAVLLYGDNGVADVDEREISEVLAIAPDVSSALGRIILQRKKATAARDVPLDAAELSASLAPPRNVSAPRPSSRPEASRPAPALGRGEPDVSLPTIPGKKRDKSRSNARSGSRPDAAPAPVELGRETEGAPNPAAAISAPGTANGSAASEAEPPAPAADDPVFMLARARPRTHTLPPPDPVLGPDPVLERVTRPPVAITLPARSTGIRPRLPSVIIEGAHASVRPGGFIPLATIKKPPTRPPSGSRRAIAPPAADPPRSVIASPVPDAAPLPAPSAAASDMAVPPPDAAPPEQRSAVSAPVTAGRPSAPVSAAGPPLTASAPIVIRPPVAGSAAVARPAPASAKAARSVVATPAAASITAARRTPDPAPAVAGAVSSPAPPAAEIENLVELLCQGSSKAAQELTRIGAATLPQLMDRFPGPVISERAGPSSRASECGPLLQMLATIGTPAIPNITRSSEDQDARVRRWATLLLGELPGPEACRAVVQRLVDEVPRVHQAALEAARLLLGSSAASQFRSALFEVAEAEDVALTLRLRTLEHAAKLKDGKSVPRLIAFLGADTEPMVHKALWALSVLTRQDFGRDAQSWWDWWQAHQSQHRCQWLIEALDHRDPRLRKAAAEELQLEANDSFGYTENLPEDARRIAREKYQKWWETVGAQRFGHSA